MWTAAWTHHTNLEHRIEDERRETRDDSLNTTPGPWGFRMASTPESEDDDPGARTRFIEHQGRQILLYDFAGVDDVARGLQIVEAARPKILGRPPMSVRTLVTVRDSKFDTRIAKAVQELARHNKPFVLASAIVGLSGLQRVILTAVMRATRRTFATFDTVEQAMDWLVAQEGAVTQ
jgi:hypothetical protein